MLAFSRKEIEDALDQMDELRRESSRAGDWTIWAQCLAEDVEFVDRIYGRYQGRQAVSDFVVRVHASFPHLRYERDWSVIDCERGARRGARPSGASPRWFRCPGSRSR